MFSRYLDLSIFVKSTNFKICDYQNKIWSNTSVSFNKHFWHILAQCWRQETSSNHFYDFNEMLIVADIYHFQFSLIYPFKKMKHWKLDIIFYWVIGAGCLIEKGLELSFSPPNHSNDFRKILTLCISINWVYLVSYWVVVQKIFSKIFRCTNTHHDVNDLVNHGMVENVKTWICWEWNIKFLICVTGGTFWKVIVL